MEGGREEVEESESRSFFSVEPMFCDDDAGDDADCSLSSQLLFLSLVVSLFSSSRVGITSI